jgi:lipopolysaccharide/colanic/teichoic acid biosynthesis glycosyltransferase
MKNRLAWAASTLLLRPADYRSDISTPEYLRRAMDVCIAGLGFVVSLPIMTFIALKIKLLERGPIFYSQERIGQGGKPFTMYKFRTMRPGAEAKGPQLAIAGDERITPFGQFLRKSRLDELPQWLNVLKGDMTLVGPRPERQFFIDRINEHAPNYKRLQQLKPGLTSLGIVSFGYASTIEEMIERQRHDQYYFENRSWSLDLYILGASLDVIIQRKGR